MRANLWLLTFSSVLLAGGLSACGANDNGGAAAGSGGAAGTISGSGATFPAAIYAKWAADYKTSGHGEVNYQGTGSGAGIDAIKKQTVDFAGTDAPLKAEELEKEGLVQFPSVIGAVVPVYNVEGVPADKPLVLSGDVLGDIYLKKITKWNDPKIVALNKGVKLPAADITVVHRSDSSGTTFMFTEYLAGVNEGWKAVGASKEPKWVEGTLGGKGNDGVAAQVKQASNSLGYVEYVYTKKNNMQAASMVNKDGKVVTPSAEGFAAAASGADWGSVPGMGISLNNQAGAGTWPITGATFVLLHKKQKDAAIGKDILSFWNWALTDGAEQAKALEFVPLPADVAGKAKEVLKQVSDAAGKPLVQ